jgi:protein involved in polysaccharide export with SLBB domain
MLCLIPAWLAIGFFNRNYQVGSDVFLIWYFLGIVIASAFLRGQSLNAIIPSWKIVGTILLVGLTFGAVSNILLFRAVATAPNPGLPVAIANVASVGVFLAAAVLSRWAPKYFNVVKIDGVALVGVALVVAGASLIAIRR